MGTDGAYGRQSSRREGRTGREYLRVSFDRSGRERSPDEQHDDNVQGAASIGVELLDAYREAKAVSASRYARKTRDDFARMLEELGSGKFGADVLVLWESSRGSRKVGEWVALVDLCDAQRVTIFVTTHGREYDPTNARDRRSLLEDAVDSEYESSKSSTRIRRATAANARDGKPHGPIPYGYVRRYDERTRAMIAQDPHPGEAPIVQELFARIIRGHTFKAIARDFDARGIRNDKGTPFSPAHLRSLTNNPTYAAIRVHRTSAEAKRRQVNTPGPDVKLSQGAWPELVSRADFMAVQQIIEDPARRTSPLTRPGKAVHFLSRIARCDVCGGFLVVTKKYRPDGDYWCGGAGHVKCNKVMFDEYAETMILAYLSRPDVHEQMTAGEADGDNAELARVREDLATVTGELHALRVKVGRGTLSAETLEVAEPEMLARIGELQTAEQALITPSALRGLIETGQDVAARWAEAELSTRRQVARILLTPELMGQLRLTRCPPGRGGRHAPPPAERARWLRPDLPATTTPPTDPPSPGEAA